MWDCHEQRGLLVSVVVESRCCRRRYWLGCPGLINVFDGTIEQRGHEGVEAVISLYGIA